MEAIWIRKKVGARFTEVRDTPPPRRYARQWRKLTVPKQEPECLEDFAGNSRQAGFWAFRWYAISPEGMSVGFIYFGGMWAQPRTRPYVRVPEYMLASEVTRSRDSFSFDSLRRGTIALPAKEIVIRPVPMDKVRIEIKLTGQPWKLIGHTANVLPSMPDIDTRRALTERARDAGWKVEGWSLFTPSRQKIGRLSIESSAYTHFVYRDGKPWFATPSSQFVTATILREADRILGAPKPAARKRARGGLAAKA